MKIWHLRITGEANYDEVEAVVVIATTGRRARHLFANSTTVGEKPGGEGPGVWLDSRTSTVVCIGDAKAGSTERVVCRSFLAG